VVKRSPDISAESGKENGVAFHVVRAGQAAGTLWQIRGHVRARTPLRQGTYGSAQEPEVHCVHEGADAVELDARLRIVASSGLET
jgi:hypothetical protein